MNQSLGTAREGRFWTQRKGPFHICTVGSASESAEWERQLGPLCPLVRVETLPLLPLRSQRSVPASP